MANYPRTREPPTHPLHSAMYQALTRLNYLYTKKVFGLCQRNPSLSCCSVLQTEKSGKIKLFLRCSTIPPTILPRLLPPSQVPQPTCFPSQTGTVSAPSSTLVQSLISIRCPYHWDADLSTKHIFVFFLLSRV